MQSLLVEHRLPCLLFAARLARSTYYYHASHSVHEAERYADAVSAMKAISQRHAQCYGYRRMTKALRDKGFMLNHKTVRRLMKEHGLTCQLRRKRYRSYMPDGGLASSNLLARDFHADKSGSRWCTDVTEFRVGGQKLYLSALQDLFNNEIVAWNMSTSQSQTLVCRMLHKAVKAGRHKEGLILHSDQGWAYRTPAWRLMLEKAGITQSMSRKGNCLDNAVIENFFSHLKVEMYRRKKYGSVKELERDIRMYIRYYNTERISLKTGGMSPVAYRTQAERNE